MKIPLSFHCTWLKVFQRFHHRESYSRQGFPDSMLWLHQMMKLQKSCQLLPEQRIFWNLQTFWRYLKIISIKEKWMLVLLCLSQQIKEHKFKFKLKKSTFENKYMEQDNIYAARLGPKSPKIWRNTYSVVIFTICGLIIWQISGLQGTKKKDTLTNPLL